MHNLDNKTLVTVKAWDQNWPRPRQNRQLRMCLCYIQHAT